MGINIALSNNKKRYVLAQNKVRLLTKIALVVLCFFGASQVWAHPEHGSHSGFIGGFEAGVLHPYGGLDHMLLALGLGLLFARGIKNGGLLGGLVLNGMLMVGFIAGIVFNFTSFFVETGIIASVVITGVLLFQSKRFQLLLITATLAVFHGIAHGMEVPQGASAIGFMLGMMLAMTLLYIIGYGAGHIILRQLPVAVTRHHLIEKLLAVIGVGALFLS